MDSNFKNMYFNIYITIIVMALSIFFKFLGRHQPFNPLQIYSKTNLFITKYAENKANNTKNIVYILLCMIIKKKSLNLTDLHVLSVLYLYMRRSCGFAMNQNAIIHVTWTISYISLTSIFCNWIYLVL